MSPKTELKKPPQIILLFANQTKKTLLHSYKITNMKQRVSVSEPETPSVFLGPVIYRLSADYQKSDFGVFFKDKS